MAVSLIPQFHILCQKLIGCVMEQFVQLGDLINPSIWAHLGMNDCGQSSQDQSREFSMTQQHKAALAQVTSYICRPAYSKIPPVRMQILKRLGKLVLNQCKIEIEIR